MSVPIIEVSPDPDALSRASAERIVTIAVQAVADHGEFTLALSGGKTPEDLYTLLGTPVWRQRLPWSQTVVFWGDERAVGPNDPESNYRMAATSLLDRVPIPPDRIHRIRGELPPEQAAEAYAQVLARAFTLGPGERPRFDLVLLGLGADGHTASLFPEAEALDLGERLVVANPVPALGTTRVTLTAPTINNAAHVLFLVTGAAKAGAVAAVLEGPRRPRELPAQLIEPRAGQL
ncbi:MAG TPA: 6-phosphogluconolactonase, partial [Chloroflexi bacterium]|nr:6-phosphogluconolactonase [Chloroflexota bacterium]